MVRKVSLLLAAMMLFVCAWLARGADMHTGDLETQFGACTAPTVPVAFESLPQGWNERAEQKFWYTSQGSQMLPAAWFLALEQPDRPALFRESSYLSSFGFIPAPVSACNPNGLPIGFAVDKDTHYIGLNCAACHTRLIDYRGRSMLVNGGPSEIDFGRFIGRLADAVEHTLSDPVAQERFRDRLRRLGATTSNLDEQLAASLLELRNFQRFIAASEKDDGRFAGPGRVDAFGAIFNKVTVGELGIASNYAPANAPVNYPFLWGAARGSSTQWNGTAPNAVPFGPLARNLGVAIGLFGHVDLHPSGAGYDSTAKIDNLEALESLAEKLQAPAWPGHVLPAIDRLRAQRGEVVYQQQCEGCHARVRDSHQNYDPRMVSVSELGTDPVMADNYFSRNADTGPLAGKKRWVVAGAPLDANAPSRDVVVSVIVGVILHHGVDSLTRADVPALLNERPKVEVPEYKARPLNGIWATAPYLHNGSVPTLRDLLEPPAQRPARFAVSVHQFDPDRVGLVVDAKPAIEFDTAAPGNSNAGHLYGTDLSDEDKADLVEFLKTL